MMKVGKTIFAVLFASLTGGTFAIQSRVENYTWSSPFRNEIMEGSGSACSASHADDCIGIHASDGWCFVMSVRLGYKQRSCLVCDGSGEAKGAVIKYSSGRPNPSAPKYAVCDGARWNLMDAEESALRESSRLTGGEQCAEITAAPRSTVSGSNAKYVYDIGARCITAEEKACIALRGERNWDATKTPKCNCGSGGLEWKQNPDWQCAPRAFQVSLVDSDGRVIRSEDCVFGQACSIDAVKQGEIRPGREIRGYNVSAG